MLVYKRNEEFEFDSSSNSFVGDQLVFSFFYKAACMGPNNSKNRGSAFSTHPFGPGKACFNVTLSLSFSRFCLGFTFSQFALALF